jgi:hypothetical protein
MKMASGIRDNQQLAINGRDRWIVSDEDIALLRQDVRAQKQQLIGKNLSLSDGEAEKLWPIYNHYMNDMKRITTTSLP